MFIHTVDFNTSFPLHCLLRAAWNQWALTFKSFSRTIEAFEYSEFVWRVWVKFICADYTPNSGIWSAIRSEGQHPDLYRKGFFIQIGTIACLLNVSLALYYLMTIKYGWTEVKMRKKRAAHFLFIPPIVVGLVYAFVGISYYDNVRVWCNNSAKQVYSYFIDLTFDKISRNNKTFTSP